MLCEKTDNEASGSTEALAATLIKYNFKKDKNNGKYSNTKNIVKKNNVVSQLLQDACNFDPFIFIHWSVKQFSIADPKYIGKGTITFNGDCCASVVYFVIQFLGKPIRVISKFPNP